jgi:hypothetical protein
MKATNIFVSAAAAISMASAIGFAYAQTGYSDTQTGTTGTMSDSATTSQDASTMNQDATGTPGYDERVARADRN